MSVYYKTRKKHESEKASAVIMRGGANFSFCSWKLGSFSFVHFFSNKSFRLVSPIPRVSSWFRANHAQILDCVPPRSRRAISADHQNFETTQKL